MPEVGGNDPRVHFAAERTFLAWIRTGLALMGFGFVVARFGLFLKELTGSGHAPGVKSYGFSLWAGSAMVLLGAMMNLAAVARHIEVIRRLNRGESILARPSVIAIAVGIVLGLVGIAMVVFLVAVS
jgi:putative membrane protein